MQKVYVDEMKNMDGLEVDTILAVDRKDPVKEYRNGYFFSLLLSDRTGIIEGRFWGPEDRALVEGIHSSIKVGDVLWLHGTVRQFRDGVALNISIDGDSIKKLSPEEYNLEDFLGKAERDIDEMWSELLGFIESVSDDDYRRLLETFTTSDYIEMFRRMPASRRYHHSYMGGLLEHTLGVVKIGLSAADLYGGIDRDLFITSAILHDIGKIKEYTFGPVVAYTTEGSLLGRTHLTVSMVSDLIRASGIPEEKAMKLLHVLLSQEGDYDYGAFMKPKIPEAVLLQYANAMDSRIKAFIEVRQEYMDMEDDMVYVARRDINRSIYLR